MADQLERACRAAAEALNGKMDDTEWRERWEWYTNAEGVRKGGPWEIITIIKAAAPILRQADPGDSTEMVERMLHAWTAAQSGPIDEAVWKRSYSPTSKPARAMRAVLEAIRQPTPKMIKAAQLIDPRYDDPVPGGEEYWHAMIDAALAIPSDAESIQPNQSSPT